MWKMVAVLSQARILWAGGSILWLMCNKIKIMGLGQN